MGLTYKDMADKISKMSQDQQQQDVTVLLTGTGEVYKVDKFVTHKCDGKSLRIQEQTVAQVDGILDKNHPYITVIC